MGNFLVAVTLLLLRYSIYICVFFSTLGTARRQDQAVSSTNPAGGLRIISRFGRTRTFTNNYQQRVAAAAGFPSYAANKQQQQGKLRSFLSDDAAIRAITITQRLDHFDGSNSRTWNQIYWINSRYYKKGGPIFLFISSGPVGSDLYWIGGGAGSAGSLPDWVAKGKKLGALCLLLEHRYYGENKPTVDLSVTSMRYLNTYQALSDIANFITNATAEYKLGNAPWVLFGCSYAGALATWARLKYPHLVSIAVASGAPLQPKMDFWEYADAVTKILRRDRDGCVERIGNATKALELMIADGQSQKQPSVKILFNLCEDIDPNDKKNISVFFAHLAENIFNVVQESKTNRAISKYNLTTGSICDMMFDPNLGDHVSRYAALQRTILSMHGLPCLSISYKDLIESLRDTRYAQNDDWRQWSFQVCNEFGFFTTSNGPDQSFGHKFDLAYYLDQCADIFGKRFQKLTAVGNLGETLRQYGGSDPKVSRVIFTYGTADPWRSIGAARIDSSSKVFSIEGASHCAEFYASDDASDTKSMKTSRKQVDKLLAKWIKEIGSNYATAPHKISSFPLIGAGAMIMYFIHYS